jgi:hypothetical protein
LKPALPPRGISPPSTSSERELMPDAPANMSAWPATHALISGCARSAYTEAYWLLHEAPVERESMPRS